MIRRLFVAGGWDERERRLAFAFGNPEAGGGAPETEPGENPEAGRDKVGDKDPTADAERLATGEVTRADAAQQRKTLLQQTWSTRFQETLTTALNSNPSMQRAVQWFRSYMRAGGDRRQQEGERHFRQAVDKYVTSKVNDEMKQQGIDDFRLQVDTSSAVTLDATASLVENAPRVPAAAPPPAPDVPPPAPQPGPQPQPGPAPQPAPAPQPQPQPAPQPSQQPTAQPLQQPVLDQSGQQPVLDQAPLRATNQPAAQPLPDQPRAQPTAAPGGAPPEGGQRAPEGQNDGEQALARAQEKMNNAKTPEEGIVAFAEYVTVMVQQLNRAFENLGRAMDRRGNPDPDRAALARRVAESPEPPAKTLTAARDAAKQRGDGLDAMIRDAAAVQPQTPDQQRAIADARTQLAAARREQAAADRLLGEVQRANGQLRETMGPQLQALTQRTGGRVQFEAVPDANGDIGIRLTGLDAMTALRMRVQPRDGVITLTMDQFREAAARLNNPSAAPRGAAA